MKKKFNKKAQIIIGDLIQPFWQIIIEYQQINFDDLNLFFVKKYIQGSVLLRRATKVSFKMILVEQEVICHSSIFT
jgi:hypothetical protein